ncbi:hypothetical protein LR004_02060 [Candidatus Gracilibacteria bacterium]|nr:hypothetical protein [Candidatus Gracilibacteria bacterium]
MVAKFSDTLTYSEGRLPEFSVDVFLESLFGDEKVYVAERVNDLLARNRGPVHKDFDLDDCIASRSKILDIPGFRNNRGEDGNIWLFAHYGKMINQDDHNIILPSTKEIVQNMSNEQEDYAIKEFIEQEYLGKNSLGLARNLNEYFWDPSCTHGIATAGIKKMQEAKIAALLGKKHTINEITIDEVRTVIQSKDKIKTNLLSLLDKEYLPKEYIMHEDRPEWFHMYDQVLANLLQINVTVKSIYINRHNEAKEKWSVKHSPKYTTTYQENLK